MEEHEIGRASDGIAPTLANSRDIPRNRVIENLEKSKMSYRTKPDVHYSQLQMEVDRISEGGNIVHCTKEAMAGEVGGTEAAEDEETLP